MRKLTSVSNFKRIIKSPVQLLSALDAGIVWICSHSGWLSAVYFTLFNRSFRREQKAVLAGRVRYSRDLRKPVETSALLRRNTHRLEKGLLMRPRHDVFALDYIGETVSCYERVVRILQRQPSLASHAPQVLEVQWAHDVLTDYFSATRPHPRTHAIRQKFCSMAPVATAKVSDDTKMVPYRRDLASKPNVNYEDLHALAMRRRSVRWFLQKAVPREAVDRAIEIAAQSPSACNRQPFQFRIIDEPKLLREVSRIPMGTSGYEDNIPMLIVIVGRLRNYMSERDRHLIYIDSSLAAMSLMFGLEVQELSSCCINWPDIESKERKMASLLKLSPDERPIMCLAVGYPDPTGLVAYSSKKPLQLLRRYNCEKPTADH